jgi:hypothetical protein
MSIYWSLKSVPELKALRPEERRRVHLECLREHFLHVPVTWRAATAFFSQILISAFGMYSGISIAESFGLKSNFWVCLAVTLIVLPIGSFVFSRIAIPVLRPFYPEFIQKSGAADS